jgi:hypothetical protein
VASNGLAGRHGDKQHPLVLASAEISVSQLPQDLSAIDRSMAVRSLDVAFERREQHEQTTQKHQMNYTIKALKNPE